MVYIYIHFYKGSKVKHELFHKLYAIYGITNVVYEVD